MPALHHTNQNQLLSALPQAAYARLAPHLELVAMPLGKMLYEPGAPMSHVYFPTSAIASLHYVTEAGVAAESASVGCDGMVGVASVLDGGSVASSAMVHTAGHGYRLASEVLHRELAEADGHTRRLLQRYALLLITQAMLSTACNRHHSLEQQLSRWLLFTLDRMRSRDLAVTQELVANMLGVRREGITEAAGSLRNAGYIRYRRGHLEVLQREGLESRTCECYAVVKKEALRLLPLMTVRGDDICALV
jgi:CRP-like cAMP-binding protein